MTPLRLAVRSALPVQAGPHTFARRLAVRCGVSKPAFPCCSHAREEERQVTMSTSWLRALRFWASKNEARKAAVARREQAQASRRQTTPRLASSRLSVRSRSVLPTDQDVSVDAGARVVIPRSSRTVSQPGRSKPAIARIATSGEPRIARVVTSSRRLPHRDAVSSGRRDSRTAQSKRRSDAHYDTPSRAYGAGSPRLGSGSFGSLRAPGIGACVDRTARR